MTVDINRVEMCLSSKFYVFYLRCASQFFGIVIALWHTFGHPLSDDVYCSWRPLAAHTH